MKHKQEYLDSAGTICPNCKHQNIEGGPVEIIGPMAVQEMSCISCNFEWRAMYRLFDALPKN